MTRPAPGPHTDGPPPRAGGATRRSLPTTDALGCGPSVIDDMVVSMSVQGDRALVSVCGEVDLSNVHHLDDALQMLGRHGVRHFLIDLDRVEFFDSHGVGAFAHLLAEHPRSRVTVAGASRLTKHLLDLAGLAGTLFV